ncbi:chemotaxis protein CheW [Stenotrophobium rhamnosiphilum]|uniref:Chemotaxis protein CheA n=1 Tax=Stenotrophobium rhamnosiphilum TaxID=2029166 RepID=A0A2T5MD95_9GAMM|nr:chemotaxis protein CheW [Stenotrophobium rhamnosiphilum]PTU30542.1 chemotaxis protein CheA [Stenotrophobium rhamnosiphilum]
MEIDFSRFHQTFFEESFEGLDVMESALLKLDIGNADSEIINTIFRAAHSMKGGAATFGFLDVAGFTHLLETLLDQMRSGQRAVTQHDVDLLLRSVDVVRGLLTAARDSTAADTQSVEQLRAELEQTLLSAPSDKPAAVSAAPVVAAKASNHWHIRFAPHRNLFRGGNDPLRIIRELGTLGEMQVTLDDQALPSFEVADAEDCYLAWNIELHAECSRASVLEVFAWVEDESDLTIELVQEKAAAAVVEAKPEVTKPQLAVIQGGRENAAPADAHKASSGESGSIRVGTEKIDSLINLVGELVITQAMLAQQAAALDPVLHEKLMTGLSQLDRNTRSMQEAVMSIRMLPMDFVFSRFPRLIRDLAGKLGKQARLVMVGESTELDKSVIEKIADPLNHLVRNSLDHGIEMPDVRLAAGKDSSGTITLKAAHRGGSIMIEVSDDGRGLDRAKLIAKAKERGITVSDNAPDGEIWQLIFAPGFSTAEKVTDISGRGVGMDVVKKNIQALGGQVDITSVDGRGMTIMIRLPLTLAILDGMSVSVGEEIFIVPLNAVAESLQPRAEDVKSIAGQGRVVRVRGEILPLVPLREVFHLGSGITEPQKGILVLIESEGRKVALMVDELVGQQQVVIKSLESNYRRISGISGATILGDGRVALILDVGELVRANACDQAA